jgi:lipopolysaccharide transport system permease protein
MTAASYEQSATGEIQSPHTVVLYPRKGMAALDLAEIYAYRNLLFLFFWREIKTRYKQSYLGGVWIVLSPLVSTAIYSVLLGYLARFPSDGVPYPLYVLVGITVWQFFSRCLIGTSTSLADQSVLISKIYFPRIIAPLAAVLSAGFDFGVMLVLLLAAMLALRIFPEPRTLLAFVFVIQMAFLALGIGLILTGIDAVMRDVRIVLNLVLQVWYFASPIIYPIRVVPQKFLTYYYINPVAPLIEGFRWAMLGGATPPPPLWSVLLSAAVSVVLLVIGALLFQKAERTIVDHI